MWQNQASHLPEPLPRFHDTACILNWQQPDLQQYCRISVVRFSKFLSLILMAFTTILRGDNCGDYKTFVFVCIHFLLICLMTFNAAYPLLSMTAMFPLIYLPLSNPLFHMAVNAFFINRRYVWPYSFFACLYLHIADYCEGYKNDEAQCADKIFHNVKIFCLHKPSFFRTFL